MLSLQHGLLLSLILISFLITYQDFKHRQVSLWVLILFGIICISSVIINRDWETLLFNGISSLLYLGLILGVLKLYLYLKFKTNKIIIDELLGLADVIVIASIGLTFNLVGTIFFFCFAFIFTVIAYFLSSFFQKQIKHQTIPLAGFLVIFYLFGIFILHLINANNLVDCSFVE